MAWFCFLLTATSLMFSLILWRRRDVNAAIGFPLAVTLLGLIGLVEQESIFGGIALIGAIFVLIAQLIRISEPRGRYKA